MSLYQFVKDFHSIFRWIIIIIGVTVLYRYIFGWMMKRAFAHLDNLLSLLFIIALDTQFLFGLLLYFFLSPNVHLSGLDMSDGTSRFYTVEHPVMMLLAIIIAHVGRVLIKKSKTDASKFQRGSICFLISLVIILSMVKW